MQVKLEWMKDRRERGSGEIGCRNGVVLFRYEWDGISGSLNPEGPWVLLSTLPGLEGRRYRARNEAEAKVRAGGLLDAWCKKLDLCSERQDCTDVSIQDAKGALLGPADEQRSATQ